MQIKITHKTKDGKTGVYNGVKQFKQAEAIWDKVEGRKEFERALEAKTKDLGPIKDPNGNAMTLFEFGAE